ncbi:MAG: hypothetical protein ABF303_13630 [Desulfobacterales bacterium]
MWGKFAIAFVCWLASLGGVIKLIHALPPSPGGGFLYHDSVTMILVGGFFLFMAMTIKKFLHFLGYQYQATGLLTSDCRLVS